MLKRRVYLPVNPIPELSERDQLVGWPAHLCGGPLHVQGSSPLADLCGAIAEFSWEEAEAMGAFVEDALDEADVLDAMTEEEPELATLWDGVYQRPGPKDNDARRKLKAGTFRLTARQKGRPSGRVAQYPVDKEPYSEPDLFRSAVVAHCRKELADRWPFIEVPSLRRMVEAARDRTRLPPAARPQLVPKGYEDWDVCEIPQMSTFGEMVEWAFLYSLAPHLSLREAVVRVVEFLFVREGFEWIGDELSRSRPLAVASLSVNGEEIFPPAAKPWFVADAIHVEEIAIAHTMNKVAIDRFGPHARDRATRNPS